MERARAIIPASVSGLSIAKQLVDAHNGSIRVESAGSGQGTAFIVTLPTSGPAGETARVSNGEQPGAEPRLDGVRVLVVDDEEDTRELIGRALEDRGAHITLASNSQDAIQILQRDDIDVLLADIAMPGDDGYSLIRQIRSSETSLSSIPAGAVTAHARDEERTAGTGGGLPDASRQAGRAGRDRADGRSPCARSASQRATTDVARAPAA